MEKNHYKEDDASVNGQGSLVELNYLHKNKRADQNFLRGNLKQYELLSLKNL